MDNFNIPVVDLSYLNSISNWDQLEKVKVDRIAQRFGAALQNSGLIFIENHGVCGELVSGSSRKTKLRIQIFNYLGRKSVF